MRRFSIALVLTSLYSLTVVGCGGGASSGPRLYNASGMVNFDGKPVADGDLIIRTVDGKHAAGAKIIDGKFTVKAASGASIVEITAMRDVEGAEYREENPGERVPVREQFVPPKYNAESTLKTEIKENTKDLNFDLTP